MTKSGDDLIELALSDLAVAVTQPTLPVFEIEEQLSVLSGRIPASLFDAISLILSDFKASCEANAGSGVQLR